VIRPLVLASVSSVALVSRGTKTSALTLDPCKDFGFAKTPVFAQAVAWHSSLRAIANSSVDPRYRDAEELCYFFDR